MNRFLTLLLAATCLTTVGQTEYPYPYNPDGNNDGYISLNDLLDLLSVYGSEFNAGILATDSISAVYYTGELDYYDCASSCVALRGNWKMLDKDLVGSYKSLLSNQSESAWLDVRNAPLRYGGSSVYSSFVSTSSWQTSGTQTQYLNGCFCQTRTRADIEETNVCDGLEDECGVCNGDGAIYECGCNDIPEGACDCEGNQLDAIGVCGGDCFEDADGDGVCDPVLGPCEGQEFVTYHGHNYELVETADGRCWFAEDLATEEFRNGDLIPLWDNLPSEIAHIDFISPEYDILIQNGKEEWNYNFSVVIDERGVCPEGWDVASRNEWNQLISAYSANSAQALQLMGPLFSSSDVILPYATNGSAGLNLDSFNNTNPYGGGNQENSAFYWSKTPSVSPDGAYAARFEFGSVAPQLSTSGQSGMLGMSIRCIKNAE